MPFSQDTTDRIKTTLRRALASSSLSDWQRSFLTDMQARFDTYGPRTRLSDKQYAKLKQILAPFETQGPPSQPQAARPRPKPATGQPAARSASRRRPPSPLKVVRKARRSLRDAVWITMAIVAVIAAVGGLFETGGPTGSQRAASGSVSTGNTVQGRVTHIRDGDTVEVAGVPIRFEKLDCAESGTAAGERATRAMRALVSGQELTCRLEGRKSYDREIGTCALSDGRDIGRYMIAEGYCGRYR